MYYILRMTQIPPAVSLPLMGLCLVIPLKLRLHSFMNSFFSLRECSQSGSSPELPGVELEQAPPEQERQAAPFS